MKKPVIKEEVVANVALMRSDQKILMQKRRVKKSGEIYWSFFGGRQERLGEKPRTTAVREVEEETGFRIQLIVFAGKNILEYSGRKGPTKKERFLYLAYIDKDISELDITEGEGAEFFDIDEIKNLPLKKNLEKELEQIKNRLQNIIDFKKVETPNRGSSYTKINLIYALQQVLK